MPDFNNVRLSSVLVVLIHTTIWLIVFQLLFNLAGLYDSIRVLSAGEKYVDEAFLLIPTLIFLFYWNSHFLIPRYLSRKSWWRYLLLLLVSFLSVFYLGYGVVFVLFSKGFQFGFADPIDFYDYSLNLHLLVLGISSSLGISVLLIAKDKQRQHAEQMQQEAELKYLNAQINPHFLYNTLNGLYAQALEEDAEKTAEFTLQLSELMRYPLKNGSKANVLLSEEITFIENFIGLQRLRLGNDYPITFTQKGKLNELRIIPFVLIPFVENAFKYGVSQKDKFPICFNLEVTDGRLKFSSQNNKTSTEKAKSHLVGIENLKRRLDLIYGDNYSLNIVEGNEAYSVSLEVVASKALLLR